MKKETFGREDIIDVYQFMEMCGLTCKRKRNVFISHKIMLKKLALRHREFPTEIVYPCSIPCSMIEKENVKNGSILLVEDECGVVLPYKGSKISSLGFRPTISSEEQSRIRNSILERIATSETEEEETFESMKPGQVKYLYRRGIKMQKEDDEWMNHQIEEEQNEEVVEVTQKKNRGKVMQKKLHYR